MYTPPLLFALATAGCNSVSAACIKAAERRRLRPVAFALVYQVAAAAVCLAGAAGETVPWDSVRFWGLSLGMGALYVRALGSMVSANSMGPASFPWALANLALVAPIGLAALWLREPLAPLDGAILAAFLATIALFVAGMRSGSAGGTPHPWRYAAVLAEVFLANGALMFGYKLKQVWFGAEAASAFLAIVFGSGALLGGAAWAAARRGAGSQATGGRGWLFALVAGALGGIAAQCLLAAVRLPAAVVFPIVQGAGLLGGVLVTAAVFHERLNGWKIAGLLAGLAVVALAGIRAL